MREIRRKPIESAAGQIGQVDTLQGSATVIHAEDHDAGCAADR